MYNEKTGNYITPVGRASFPVLVEPKQINGQGEPKFQLTILFDKEAQQTQDYKDLEAAVEKAIAEKWGDDRPRKLKLPFLTIDDLTNKIPSGYTDEHTFIRLNSTVPVGVVKKTPKGAQALEGAKVIKQELYAGCDVKASVNVYAWENRNESGAVQNRGVSFGLSNVMKVADNEPFGATNAKAEDDFGEPVTGGSAADFMD